MKDHIPLNEIELQKVGIQILSNEGLANIFPDYQDLIDNIEKCRHRICRVNRKGHYQYNLMYDNVFSIIGKRGTGKTSAIFTLKKMIEDSSDAEHLQDLLLPIIMPELFASKDGILDWILAGLEEEIHKLEETFSENDAGQFSQACKYNRDKESNQLRKQYERLLEQNFSGKYRADYTDSYYEAIGNSAKQVRNSYRLMEDIYKFWDLLIESIKKTADCKEQEGKEPLIYFFFDDVDLSPDKVEELLTAIRVYLAHPNLIVIITADEDVFLEVIENKMDEKMGRLQKDQRNYLRKKMNETLYDNGEFLYYVANNAKENAEDELSDMARMYLGKILPPSTRYYLRIFQHPEEKRNFICSVGKDMVTLFSLINMQMNRLLGHRYDSIDNFLHYKKEEIIFYLEFVGDTARQIGNEIWIINSLVNNMLMLRDSRYSEDQKINLIFNYIHSFLHATFVNNHRILGIISNIDVFLREIIKKEYNDWNVYINYNFINHYFEKYRGEHDGKDDILNEIGIKIYAILYFAENILLILERKKYYKGNRRKIHGLPHFIEFLSAGRLDKDLLRSSMKLDEFLYHYGNLLMNMEDFKEEDIMDVKFIRRYLYKFANVKNIEISLKKIFSWYINDQEWLKKICQLLFLYFEHIHRFDKETVEKSFFVKKEGLQYAFEEMIARETREVFARFIAMIGVSEEARKQYELIQTAFNGMNKYDGIELWDLFVVSREEVMNWLHQEEYYTISELMTKIYDISVIAKNPFEDWQKSLLYIRYEVLKNLLDKRMSVNDCQEWLLENRVDMDALSERMKYIIITDADEVLHLIHVLQEYREGEYSYELQNFINVIKKFRKDKKNVLVLEKTNSAVVTFLRLIQDINRDALTGRRVVKKPYGDNFNVYSDICRKIFRHIDIGIASSNFDEFRDFLELFLIVRNTKMIQQFLYIGMIMNHTDEISYNRENIYYDLYRFIKNKILRGPLLEHEESESEEENEHIILKTQMKKWIAEARGDYLNKILSDGPLLEQDDE